MKLKDLQERYIGMKKYSSMRDDYVLLYINPSSNDLDDITKEIKEDGGDQWIKGMIMPSGNIYAWRFTSHFSIIKSFINMVPEFKDVPDFAGARLEDFLSEFIPINIVPDTYRIHLASDWGEGKEGHEDDLRPSWIKFINNAIPKNGLLLKELQIFKRSL